MNLIENQYLFDFIKMWAKGLIEWALCILRHVFFASTLDKSYFYIDFGFWFFMHGVVHKFIHFYFQLLFIRTWVCICYEQISFSTLDYDLTLFQLCIRGCGDHFQHCISQIELHLSSPFTLCFNIEWKLPASPILPTSKEPACLNKNEPACLLQY